MNIPVNKILPNPEQPRTVFEPDALKNLADSIRRNGLINPISVEDAGGNYILIDGERRWRAVQLLGLKEIEASVRPGMNGKGQQERLKLALVANLQREDMTPTDEARAFKKMQDMGMSNTSIANAVGTNYARIADSLSLLRLDPEIQDLVDSRKLPKSTRVGDALMAIQNRDVRIKLAKRVARPGVTIDTIVKACTKLSESIVATRLTDPALDISARRSGKTMPTAEWDALRQLKLLPPWERVQKAARLTCSRCALADEASMTTCKDCPAVELLTHMIEDQYGH